jgi:SPP1 family predicted phage head-tail adaptor
VWASVLPVSDGERWRAGEVAAHITARFTVRWSQFAAGITPKDRLIYKDAEHDIFSVKEIGRREWIEITAAARAD